MPKRYTPKTKQDRLTIDIIIMRKIINPAIKAHTELWREYLEEAEAQTGEYIGYM